MSIKRTLRCNQKWREDKFRPNRAKQKFEILTSTPLQEFLKEEELKRAKEKVVEAANQIIYFKKKKNKIGKEKVDEVAKIVQKGKTVGFKK